MLTDNRNAILLVDDNAAHRTLIKRAIVKAGIHHPVLEASGLQEARSLLFSNDSASASPPAVAVIDLNLVDGRGTTLISELRSSSRHKQVPILVLSTSGLDADIKESYERGANCYLIKSSDVATFCRNIAGGVSFFLG